jgi:MFS family permease
MPKPPDITGTIALPSRRQALSVCLVTIFMTLLDMSIVNLTLPQIQQSLHLTPTDSTLMLAGNALVFGLFLVPSGRLGDMYGRRRLLLAGLWLFLITAVACAVAPTAAVMVGSRLVRGAASGLIAPQSMGIIQRMFDGPRRGRIFGYFGAIVGMSTAVGPLLSGLLIQLFGADAGWRLSFWVTVPVVVIALIVGYRSLPADPARGGTHRLDVPGTTLLTVALLCVMLPVLQMSGKNSHPHWWFLAVGAVFAALFVWWERRVDRRGGEPVISFSLMRTRSFTAGVIIVTVFFAGFTSIFIVMAMFLQQGLKYTALHAALVMLIFTVGSAAAAIVSGRLAYRYGRWLVPAGAVVAAVGVGAMAAVAHQAQASNAVVALAAPLLVSGIGCGMLISANQFRSLQDVRHAHGGVAFSVYETAQRIATAVGTAVATALYFRYAGTARPTGSGATAGGPRPGGARAGSLDAMHATTADSLNSIHTAVAAGLAVPAVFLALAAVVGLINLMWPRRAGEPVPAIGETTGTAEHRGRAEGGNDAERRERADDGTGGQAGAEPRQGMQLPR